ncbi:MAG: serine hydrolase [Hyphomicrobiaceae bacterium]
MIQDFCGADPGRSIALADGLGRFDVIHARGNVPRPAASVIKVATVMALFDAAEGGNVDLAEQVPLRSLGATRYCSILKAFDGDRALSLREIAALSLITSDNPATVHVLGRLSFADVETVLRDSGCSNAARITVGFGELELGPANRANQMTALDALKLFRRLQSEPRYRPIVTFLENNLRNARIPALLPDDAVIAHKTGSLDGVVNDVGVVSRAGQAFDVAFLCDRQADPIQTQNDIAACSLALFELLIGPAVDVPVG